MLYPNFPNRFCLNGIILIIICLPFFSFSQEATTIIPYGNWNNVKGFSVNEEENFLILEMVVNGRSILYQSKKENGNWTEASPINELNKFLGDTSNIGGPFLCNNGTMLYFHANYPNSLGDKDIYSSGWNGETWSNPENIGESVNSIGNEESPSITVTNDKIFFTRENPNALAKQKREISSCKIILFSVKDISGKWKKPVALIDPISVDCEATPAICADGKTLFFSSIRGDSESFDLFYTKEVLTDVWLIPLPVPGTKNNDDDLDPQYINGNISYITSFIKKKIYNGTVYKNTVIDEMKPSPIVKIEGKITDLKGNPVGATLQVINPITSSFIGLFFSDPKTGFYSLPLLPSKNYFVNIRKNGYSLSTFEENLVSSENKIPEKHSISLFSTITLILSVFDCEIFRPLVSDISVIDQETKEAFNANIIHVGDGIYNIELPIGKKYKIKADKLGFEPGEMDFSLIDDIIFSKFERNLALKPLKKEFEIKVTDYETKENLSAEIVIKNLDRDETIVVNPKDITEGKATVLLRSGDRYEFNIKGPKGYSFYNSMVDFKSDIEKRTLDVELKSLKAQTSITLNNITFEINSADLNEVSFAELKRVVTLLQDNPNLKIEISAHTDDKGTDQYNNKLSERRADSVVKYLIENGIPVERLVAKGYGESVPVVPNTSDENRGLNRRVEFKIVGFVNDTN